MRREKKELPLPFGTIAICLVVGSEILAAQRQPVPPSESGAGMSSVVFSEKIRRTLSDSQSGLCWSFTANPRNAAGPGIWTPRIQDPSRRSARPTDACDGFSSRKPAQPGERTDGGKDFHSAHEQEDLTPVLRAGDRVVVEEHTSTANSYLEAVALQSAMVGEKVQVRLAIGKRTIQAVVLGPARAAFFDEVPQ